ncbi:hypothetical protein MBAV_006318 [Candidatus Magnetobacterium bavaricum]|uniref:Uncharacterized protein n=1 Tax=Candidatus Magnetobacterium bavaricum TaxID=29290 RepID=A0A0F3GI37_9BACT|nr:hypothetical protein MBAV_006318 [Candidatus Magnetobacterium bavaricum]
MKKKRNSSLPPRRKDKEGGYGFLSLQVAPGLVAPGGEARFFRSGGLARGQRGASRPRLSSPRSLPLVESRTRPCHKSRTWPLQIPPARPPAGPLDAP